MLPTRKTCTGTADCVVRRTLLLNTAVSAAKSLHHKQAEKHILCTFRLLCQPQSHREAESRRARAHLPTSVQERLLCIGRSVGVAALMLPW